MGDCLWTLCKTIIEFSLELLVIEVPNVATAVETGNPVRVSVSPWEKTNKTVFVLVEIGSPSFSRSRSVTK
jgi:hypothetical protein